MKSSSTGQEPELEFCLIAEAGALETQARLLCESIRRFSGRYAGAPVTVISPRPDRRPGPATVRALEALDVAYEALDFTSPTPEYGTSWRVLGLGWMAGRPGPANLVQLDSDTVFLDEPSLALDGHGCAARPVDVQGMCSRGPGDPNEAIWVRLAEACGVDLDAVPYLDTTVDGARVRASYNGGLVVAPRQSFARFEEMFRRICAAGVEPYAEAGHGLRAGAGLVSARGFALWGTSQAAISLALAGRGETVRILPPDHNVPLHSLAQMRAPPERVAHLHYHWLFDGDDPNPALDGRLPLDDERRDWLRARLPLRPRPPPAPLLPPAPASDDPVRDAFDAAYYLSHNPDVAASGVDPLEHYRAEGWRTDRNPAPWFKTGRYLEFNPDVAKAGVNPFEHYIRVGEREGRPGVNRALWALMRPHFDADYYRARNPDVAADDSLDPLEHFIAGGWHEGRDPAPDFSLAGYLEANPEVGVQGMNPFEHYLTRGSVEAASRTNGARPPRREDAVRPRSALLVTGMHRGGTSAMARTLSLLGAALPQRLTGASPYNRLGHWEPRELVRLNDRLLTAAGSRWDDVFAIEVVDRVDAANSAFAEEAAAILAEDFDDAAPMVIKDPRLALTSGFWRPRLAALGISPTYVIMLRHPFEVAASLQRRNQIGFEQALLLWTSYMLAAERGTRGADRVFVAYADLLADPEGVLSRLLEAPSRELAAPEPAAVEAIRAFLQPGERHHVGAIEDFAAAPQAWPAAERAYRWMLAAAGGAEGPTDALTAVEAELRALKRIVGPLLCAPLQRPIRPGEHP